MLFLARMDVQFPPHLDPQEIARLQRLEKEYSQAIQQDGRLAAIWRVVGEYANYSVFDVESNDDLHRVLSGFPMYQYLKIKVTPLATHPNSIG
jgi:muconolactone D-isomerase